MAIVNVSYDTKTKEAVCSINGTVIDKITSISFYKEYDSEKNSMSITIEDPKEEDGLSVYTSVYAEKLINGVQSK